MNAPVKSWKRWLALGVAAILVAAGLAAAYVVHKQRSARDVRGSSTEEFVTSEAPPPKPPPRQASVLWPTFGYSPERRREAPFELAPPFRRVWTFRAQSLLEFPPAIAHGRLFFSNNAGVTFAVSATTGKRAWKRAVGRCVASSPAVTRDTVYQVFLNRPPCNRDVKPGRLEGEVIAFSTGHGTIRWRTRLGPTESSPLVARGRVFVGDWRGRVYALDARTGKVRWTFATKGRVKGALALAGDRLFVGSYDHHVYALSARTGKLLWRTSAQDRLGKRGTFYSTPAAAYGRVYIGSTDGKVYSFGAKTGKIRWSHSTGGYVYASPAVWQRKVYVGSYSGRFYAFDAATGDVLWRFKANGRISGSATVMNGVVYFATLKERTYALDARTGRQLWTYEDGKYSPVVADRDRLYLVGKARIYGMVERSPKPEPAAKPKPAKKKKRTATG